MMRKLLRILSFLVPVLCFPITVPAQVLDPLPEDGALVKGSLDNGLRYYLLSNPAYKGMMDVALVQKMGKEDEPYERRGETTVSARASLDSLTHLGKLSPYTYMYGKSLWPRPEGYVRVDDHYTVYRFDNLVTSRKGAVVDSTLLVIFDIINSDQARRACPTDNQAVVIAGDIEPGEILGKMKMLSLFVSSRIDGEKETAPYEWHSLMTPDVTVTDGPPSFTVSYRFSRTPRENMNTVVPYLTARYALTLRLLLQRRLSLALKRAGIPYSRLGFGYVSSRDQGSDESMSVSIATSEEHLQEALKILSSILADLDQRGVEAEEYADIAGALSLSMYKMLGGGAGDNAMYVDECISSFLYGTSVASGDTRLGFFSGRVIDPARSAALFGKFASALLDRSRNLSIEWSGPGDEKSVLKAFQSAWVPREDAPVVLRADTLTLGGRSKSSLKSTAPETLFGGEVWTFANGIKVIYKQLPGNGFLRWSWVLGGGYSSLPGISPGEAACLPDLLRLCNVAGMSPDRFFGMLDANGISLETDIAFSETTLSGFAPEGKLTLLLKALSALGRSRSPNGQAWEYYRDCEALRSTDRSVECVLDSLVHQTVVYSPYKRPGVLRNDLPARADIFYSKIFSKMNDGVLVIVGGMDKDKVSKILSQYLGGFKTEKAATMRSRVRHGLREGRVSYRTAAREPSLAISLTAPFNYTAVNFMAANIAAYTMKDHISASVSSVGWRADADWTLRMFPDESLDMTVYLNRVDENGLPASMAREDSVDVVLSKVRGAVEKLGREGISPEELKVGKSIVANYYSSWAADPATVMRLLVLRYSYGRDLVTGYASKISEISAATVNPLLSQMASGVSGEYIVSRAFVPAPDEGYIPQPKAPYIPPVVYLSGAYSFDGSTLTPAPWSPDSLGSVPVRDYGEDSLHIAWRDSVVIGRALRALEGDIDAILEDGR